MRGGVLVKGGIAVMIAAALGGCSLDDDGARKDSCNVQADCLAGYVCTNQTCLAHPDAGGVVLPDAPSSTGEYGAVMAFTSASSGLAAENYKALIGATSAGGNLGCAVIRDEMASPGTATSLVYAKIPRGESGDTRCPGGNHAIVNMPTQCVDSFSGLRDNCAVYKQWNANGAQIASRLAIGGYVAIQDTRLADMDHRCNVELHATFAGGVTIKSTFTFNYNPYAPTSQFCTH